MKPIKQQSKIDGACSKITGQLLQRELPHAPNPLGVVARSLFRGFFLMRTKPHLTEIALLAPSVPRILQSRQVAKSFRPSRSNWDYGFFQSYLMPHPKERIFVGNSLLAQVSASGLAALSRHLQPIELPKNFELACC